MNLQVTRIETCFSNLTEAGRCALIPFVSAGDSLIPDTVALMHQMVAAGADMIELGMPFSDPMADGPVIQRSSERALARGTHTADVLEMVARFRSENTTTPVILMGYLNPIEIVGYDEFAERAQSAGVDGVIVVDLPPEESEELSGIFADAGLALIFLLSPTTSETRVEMIARRGHGFVYYISVTGVTGGKQIQTQVTSEAIATARRSVQLPMCVGFGIRTPEAAAEVAQFADGVIVGSALIARIEAAVERGESVQAAVQGMLAEYRVAMDAQSAVRASA